MTKPVRTEDTENGRYDLVVSLSTALTFYLPQIFPDIFSNFFR